MYSTLSAAQATTWFTHGLHGVTSQCVWEEFLADKQSAISFYVTGSLWHLCGDGGKMLNSTKPWFDQFVLALKSMQHNAGSEG